MNRKILDNLRAHIPETFNVDMLPKKNIELRELIDYIDDEVTGRYFPLIQEQSNSAYWNPIIIGMLPKAWQSFSRQNERRNLGHMARCWLW